MSSKTRWAAVSTPPDRAARAPGARRRGARAVGLLVVSVLAAACTAAGDVADAGTARLIAPSAELWLRVLAAEDARGHGEEGLAPLVEAVATDNTTLRGIAVRALGRLERADLVRTIAPLLSDSVPAVRAQAANALGQAVLHADAAAARTLLREALSTETDARVRGVMAETLGRLAPAPAVHGGASGRRGGRGDGATEGAARGSTGSAPVSGGASAESGSAIAADAATLAVLAVDADSLTRLGAIKGLYFLSRQPGARQAVFEHAGDALRAVATSTFIPPAESKPARARRLAVTTLLTAGPPDPALVDRWLQDDDLFLRREAVLALPRMAEGSDRERMLGRALADAAFPVRYEALRVAGGLGHDVGCGPALDALRDVNPNIVLLAIDQLRACEGGAAAIAALDSIAGELDAEAWHDGAHATVALAARDPSRAAAHLPALAGHQNAFARMYAARAATAIRDVATLRGLAADREPNVRTAAVQGLSAVEGHAADDIYIAQLRVGGAGGAGVDATTPSRGSQRSAVGGAATAARSSGVAAAGRRRVEPDPQLMMALAAALEGSPHREAPGALLDALDRLTAARWQTSRDGRVALLDRARTLGGPTYAARVRPYLGDFDPRIAELAADVIADWTGQRPRPAPRRLPPEPVPTFDEVAALERARVVLEMEGGGEVVVRLFPFVAPTNAVRFARLAARGGYNGLTLHRVSPNFVVQGGSPGANEYSGAGPFSRDELGIEGNWRGTVGLSTRGRDTGDAQFYVNLLDNVRLDHQYTTFGVVVAGMEVVDRLVEGARIRRARIE